MLSVEITTSFDFLILFRSWIVTLSCLFVDSFSSETWVIGCRSTSFKNPSTSGGPVSIFWVVLADFNPLFNPLYLSLSS